LVWAYSFGHFAAEQEFRNALAADPDCAMARRVLVTPTFSRPWLKVQIRRFENGRCAAT